MSDTNTPPVQPQPNAEITALQSEIQTLKNYIGEIGPFVQDASYLIAAIAKDPVLKDNVAQATNNLKNPPVEPVAPVQTTLRNAWKFDPHTGQPIQQAQAPVAPQAPQSSPQVQSIDIKMREDIIAQIEGKYGYTQLPADQRKAIRGKVEQQLNSWNTSVLKAPVNELPKLLEDAYILSDIGKAKEEGRLDGLIEARSSEMGMLPTMSSAPQKTETTALSSEQQMWSKRWNLDQDKVTERLKEFSQNGGVMTYKPKEEVKDTRPSPSGQPAGPQAQ